MINRLKTVWYFITSPNYSRTVSILALLVVVLAIPLTVFIAQKQQEIRQRAEGERVYCGGNGQPAVGQPVGTCEPDANGCTATKFTRYIETTGDGQAWCDYVCAEPKTCPGAPTATPPPSTTSLPPTAELSITPSSGGVGTEFTLRGHVTASSTDSRNPSYLITKVEIWATKRGTPDQVPANCPGAQSGIWCNIETQWVSGHDVPFEKKWTAPATGDYLFIVNGISSNGVWCTGNPQPPAGWADCSGSTGKTDMAEVVIRATQVNACNKSCALTNQDQGGKTAPSQCTEANTYFYVQTEGWPQGQCSTACLTCPANTKPSDDKCNCVPVPTPTTASAGVEICGKTCKIFGTGPDIVKDPSQCSDEDKYIDSSNYNRDTQTCLFYCRPVPAGQIRSSQGCSLRPIPSGNGNTGNNSPPGPGPGEGPGQPNPTATPRPGAPAPTSPPTGTLTNLLFDLILPGATKDKRIVAQIFPTAPTPTPTPTTTPGTTPAPTPTPTAPASQLGPDLGGTVARSSGGNHTGTVTVGNLITSGTYDIKVKADKYLRKLIAGLQITQDTTTRLPQTTLVLGDINGDNKLDIQDYNILIDCFGTNASACGNNKDFADLDDNGRVDGVDYNLFLRSMAKGVLQGD